MMKTCFKCDKTKLISEFYKHPKMADGVLGKCKICTKKDVQNNYRKNRKHYQEYEQERFQRQDRKAAVLKYQRTHRSKHSHKHLARTAVGNAVRDGRVQKKPCEVCGEQKVEAHHEDYSKPLEVRWLCFKHHRETHGQIPF